MIQLPPASSPLRPVVSLVFICKPQCMTLDSRLQTLDFRLDNHVRNVYLFTKMKTLPNAMRIGWAAFLISQGWAADSETAKKDSTPLQGEWSMVSGTADGV